MYEAWTVWDGNKLLEAFDGEKKALDSVEGWNDKLNIDTVEVLGSSFDKPYRNHIWFTEVDGVIENIWPVEVDAIDDKNWMIDSRQYDDCEIKIDKIPVS